MNPSFKYTKFFSKLTVKFEEEQIEKISDALFLVYHPMSVFYEKPFKEKKDIAILDVLGDIEWESFQEIEEDYKQLVIPREKSMYIHMSHLLDWTYEAVSKIREQRLGKLQYSITPALLKEITVFAKNFSSLKDDLRKERANAKKAIEQKTYGNIILSASDDRFARS